MQAVLELALGLKTKDFSKPFAILLICKQTESQDAPEKVVATQKYASLLFYSALSYSWAVLSCFTHEGMWLSSPPCASFSLHWQRPFPCCAGENLVTSWGLGARICLKVLHFRRCVWGTGAEAAGRWVRVTLTLLGPGCVRHHLKQWWAHLSQGDRGLAICHPGDTFPRSPLH